MDKAIVLQVDDLHLQYGDNPVLKGVSMSLRKGEVVSLLGPSGSGKTTLLRAVAGLEGPCGGRIAINGQAVYDSAAGLDQPTEQRDLGLVFQSYALWPHKTIFDNVAYPLKLRRVATAEISTRVREALEQLGLGHLAERYPHQLSGGQQQRVAIARALVYNPPLILLDEPLSNLDAKLREEARAWLRELITRMGLSALCVTHDQAEAMAMSDRILLLSQGRIEQQGSPQEMYSKPVSLFAAEFMGSNNRLHGRITARNEEAVCVEGEGWTLWGVCRPEDALQTGQEATAVIRLERMRLADEAPASNQLEAELTTSMYLGDRWEHLFHVDGQALRTFSAGPHPTGRCRLHLPQQDLWVFPA